MEGYVYTLEAARSRLRRGHRSVLIFQPGTAKLIKLTKSNWTRTSKFIRYSS